MSSTNTQTVGRNTFWYGLEIAFEFVVAFGCSIAMARVIGPERLGYFNYVMWLCNTGGLVGALGIPTSMRKYMAEWLGQGQAGLARSVFEHSLRRQAVTACAVWAMASAGALLWAAPGYRTIALLMAGSMLAGMLGMIPAQANAAAENLAANVPATLVGQTLFAGAVATSLLMGWDLLGIAAGIFLFRWVELVVRLMPVLRWLRSLPSTALPPEARARVSAFSRQSLVLMILDLLVWNRSGLILLRFLSSDMAQLSYYSVAFNLAEKARIAPSVFGVASGASLMAQQGRDPSAVAAMASRTLKYSLLVALPLLAGLAGLSPVVVPTLYGGEYLPAIPGLALAAMFAVASVAIVPGQQLFQAADHQKFLIICTSIAGVLSLALDLHLIPAMGATGAVIGSGIAQTLAVVAIWWYARRRLGAVLDLRGIAGLGVAGLLTLTLVALAAHRWGTWWTLLAGPLLGAGVYLATLWLLKPLDTADGERFRQLLGTLPAPLRDWAVGPLGWFTHGSGPASDSRRNARPPSEA